METEFKRYKRYVKYLVEWIFKEKIKGLDFTMRDISLIEKTGGVFHGYSKTDEGHANAIFEYLKPSKEMKLLDVGCGKGAFLRVASNYPFAKIAGIEIDEKLVKIAKQNFRILKLNKVGIYCSDAMNFEHYDSFNIFYFFNPFEREIMEKVIEKVADTQNGKYWIILHNPVNGDVIEELGGKLIKKLYDKVKSYETYIYECGE